MNFTFLVWLLALLLTAALLGITMYSLISLSDLENDFINPHDSSVSINRWVEPKYVIEAVLFALLLLTGKWVTASLLLGVCAWDLRTYLRSEHKVDVTEIFRQIPHEKKVRMVSLLVYLVTFVITIYKLVETAIYSLLNDDGRRAAHNLFKEAAATM
ncbi:hypothetical protein WJX81_006715 [Elliptochloris bilobata]|uniref:Cornichon n=1 Tax=Elliptochloris bilobata TaxID=381761 RepID=A0AAW1R0J5_9CHLO